MTPPKKRPKGKTTAKRVQPSNLDPLHIGNDDPAEAADGVQVYVSGSTVTGDRLAALLPRSLRNLGPEATLVVAEIQDVVTTIDKAQRDLSQLVAEARELGVSWGGIGWCVGTSDAAARQRWGQR